MDVEIEIVEIKRRLTLLENEVKADRELPVRLFTYLREMRDDIGLLRSHAVVTEKRIETLENNVAELRSEFNSFRKEFPNMVADAMREVLKESRSR